jgi:hypothetical protein
VPARRAVAAPGTHLLVQILDRIARPDPGVAVRSGLMAVEWTGSGSELLLDQDRIDSVSHVEREVRGAARDRRLPVGQPGPTSRALAEHFGVSCGLVPSPCPQVQSEGCLTARAGPPLGWSGP